MGHGNTAGFFSGEGGDCGVGSSHLAKYHPPPSDSRPRLSLPTEICPENLKKKNSFISIPATFRLKNSVRKVYFMLKITFNGSILGLRGIWLQWNFFQVSPIRHCPQWRLKNFRPPHQKFTDKNLSCMHHHDALQETSLWSCKTLQECSCPNITCCNLLQHNVTEN